MGENGQMLRREFLQGVVVTTLGMGASNWAAFAAGRTAGVTVDPALLGDLEEETTRLVRVWDWPSLSVVQQEMHAHRAVLAALVDRAGPRAQERLWHMQGRASATLGWLAYTLGQRRLAIAELGEAEALADYARDPQLSALALLWRADVDSTVQAGITGPSPAEVVDRLDAAAARLDGGASRGLRAYVRLRRAEELMACRRELEAWRELEAAAAAWAAAGGDGDIFGRPWPGEPLHAAFHGVVALAAGEPQQALEVLARQRPSGGATTAVDRLGWHTSVATAWLDLGQLEHGLDILRQVWLDARDLGLRGRQQRALAVRLELPAGLAIDPIVRRCDAETGWL